MFREGLVKFCDIRSVVLVVMDFHRFCVDERLEGVVIVAECGNLMGFCAALRGGWVGLRADGEGAGGQSEGFQTFTTCNHHALRFTMGSGDGKAGFAARIGLRGPNSRPIAPVAGMRLSKVFWGALKCRYVSLGVCSF